MHSQTQSRGVACCRFAAGKFSSWNVGRQNGCIHFPDFFSASPTKLQDSTFYIRPLAVLSIRQLSYRRYTTSVINTIQQDLNLLVTEECC
jgi:hypothetical protein